MNSTSNPIYSRRKRFLPEYRELFTALLKIPDQDVRDRVTDAINGVRTCPKCKTNQDSTNVIDAGTQTEDNSFCPRIEIKQEDIVLEQEEIIKKQNGGEKRRRKRKRNCPKVVKTAQYSSIVPVLKQQPNNTLPMEKVSAGQQQQQPRKIMRMDSNDDAVSCFFDNNVLDLNLDDKIFHNQNTLDSIKHQMKIEWETCDKFSGGYLPIHDAIIENELLKLKRQLYVWKFRRCDLMTLLTEDNDLTWKRNTEERMKRALCAFYTCKKTFGVRWGMRPQVVQWMYTAIVRPILAYGSIVWWKAVEKSSYLQNLNKNIIQLAVKENCIKSIFDELLKENLNLDDSYDNDCNNIIHLAVTHLSSDGEAMQQKKLLQTLESLLIKVDLAKKLLEKNDDGLTPLHIAVKRNEYYMAEKILSVLDESLNLERVPSLNDPCADEKTFSHHYCRQCDSFEGRETNDLKQEILNATDMKRGCSALYFAIELGYEHLVYLLLAHMCNPTIKNLAGLDAKTYYTETGKNASIVGILEKLPNRLKKQNRSSK